MLIVVLTVFGIAVAVVGVVYARRQASPPGRVLRVDASPPAPLLASDSVAAVGIEVTRDGRTLTDPSVVTITLDSDGDYDIARSAFDDGKPIAVDLGAPIVELLQQNGITASFQGSVLSLGPDLIKKGSRATVLALVEGNPDVSSLPSQMAASLVDVAIVTSSQSGV